MGDILCWDGGRDYLLRAYNNQICQWKMVTDMTDVLSEEELGGIEARANAATEGPWGIESCGEKGDGSNMIGVLFDTDVDTDCERPILGWAPECRPMTGDFIEYYRHELVAECEHRNRNSGRDAEFIAHARTDIPRLLAHIRATSSRPSGAEAAAIAMREAAHKLAITTLDFINGHEPSDREALRALARETINTVATALPIAPQEVSEEQVEAGAYAAAFISTKLLSRSLHAELTDEECNAKAKKAMSLPSNREWAMTEARYILQAALSVKEKKNG